MMWWFLLWLVLAWSFGYPWLSVLVLQFPKRSLVLSWLSRYPGFSVVSFSGLECHWSLMFFFVAVCFVFLAFLLVAWFLLVFLSVSSNCKQNENVYMPRICRGSCLLRRRSKCSYWNCKFQRSTFGKERGQRGGCCWWEPLPRPLISPRSNYQLVRSKFSNTRRLIGKFFFILFLQKLIQRGLAFIWQEKLESPLIKVTLRMTFLSRQSSCVVIVPSQLANHAWLRITVPTYWVCTFELFTQLQNQFLP